MTLQEIRNLKRELGYTNEQLAEKSGVPLSTVQKVISGTTKSPRRKTLEALWLVLEAEAETRVPASPARYPDASESSHPSMVSEAVPAFGEAKRRYTIEDVYALPDHVYAELIDGQLYFKGTPTRTHQKICGEMHLAVANYIRAKGGKCETYIPPFGVYLFADDSTFLIPDLTVVCDTSKLNEDGCMGAPDWVVEVLSPATANVDLGKKLFKYRKAGVREYWIIYPTKRMVVVYCFATDEEKETVTIYPFEHEIPCGIFPDLKIRLADHV